MYSYTTDVNVNGKMLFRNFSLLFLTALLIMFIPSEVHSFSPSFTTSFKFLFPSLALSSASLLAFPKSSPTSSRGTQANCHLFRGHSRLLGRLCGFLRR